MVVEETGQKFPRLAKIFTTHTAGRIKKTNGWLDRLLVIHQALDMVPGGLELFVIILK